MKQWNKFILTFSVLALFCCVMSPFGGIALGAVAPTVTVLPVFKDGTVTPARLATDGSGNIYVSDPHAEGVLKFDSVGKLVQKFVTAKEPGGIAIDQSGRLLVTQGTYVVALNADGSEYRRFGVGTFKLAYAITVDNRAVGNGGTGRIYVSDIQDYCVQVYDSTYVPVTLSAHDPGGVSPLGKPIPPKPLNSFGASTVDYVIAKPGVLGKFNRPAGLAFETKAGLVAVADSLNGKIQFFDQDGGAYDEFGTFGYDPNFPLFTYPQSIAFEYIGGALARAYVLDTNQAYVMAVNTGTAGAFPASADPLYPSSWTRLSGIGSYGHGNGNLIAPSDILLDTKNSVNNRLLVSNGFGSISVYGLASLQAYNVNISNVTSSSMTVNWTNPTPASSYKYVRVYRSTTAGQLGTLISGNLASGTASLPVSGLTPYTTYYYTVRIVDNSSVEMGNIDQVSAKTTGNFGLTITVFGNGQVNGTVTCPGAGCSTTQPSDSIVTLTASPSGALSHFNGWTGDCMTTADTCQVTMDSAKFVTATFETMLAFRVDGAYYDNLQDAYSKAEDGSVIKVMNGVWPSTTHSTEYMTAWQSKNVTIEGGYDATFTSNTGGSSTVTGRANLSAGKVVMKQFKIQY